MRKFYLVVTILGIALLLSWPRSTAKADLAFPLVFTASVDANANTMTITGNNFGNNPTVILGGSQQLSVQSSNSTQIITSLPPNLAAGNYLLTVRFGNFTFTLFDVTIGAVGPPGPGGSGGGDHLFQDQKPASQPVGTTLSSALASVSVPSGSYLILGKTSLLNGDTQSSAVGCFLAPGAGAFPFDSTNTSLAAQQSTALSLQFAATFSQPTTLTLGCLESTPGVDISASNTVLSVLSVGGIN